MPLEIRELVVRATVNSSGGSTSSGGTCSPSGNGERDEQFNGISGTVDSAASQGSTTNIVQECVEQVLAILERQKDR